MATSTSSSHRIWIAVALGALAACVASTAGLSPLEWKKVTGAETGGAVLDHGPAGSFDELTAFTVRALEDEGEVWLYYGGSDATNITTTCPGIRNTNWRVGLAKSTDGVTFTRVVGDQTGGSILDLGAPGTFDSWLAYRPFVLKDGPTWRMWYNGSAQPFRCPVNANDRRVGYADSTDGIHWTKHYDGAGPGGSVIPLGAQGTFDEQQIGYVWVLKNGTDYWMYYSAADAQANWRVGLAISHDGKTWTKKRGKTTPGAVLDLGPAGSLDAACAYQPSVVKEADDLWRMWYRACSAPTPVFGGPGGGSIGYAESNDGITWVKIPQPGAGGAALVHGPAGAFDSGGLTTPSVILGVGEWAMYYAGFDTTGTYRVGLARAPR